MDGVVHRFYLSTESDINQEIEHKVTYKFFSETHEKIYVEDCFIQILLEKKCLIDVPSYDYKNQVLGVGLHPLSGTVFRNNQLTCFLNKLCIFENEINSKKIVLETEYFNCSRNDILKELSKLKKFLKKGIDNNLCFYHIGL